MNRFFGAALVAASALGSPAGANLERADCLSYLERMDEAARAATEAAEDAAELATIEWLEGTYNANHGEPMPDDVRELREQSEAFQAAVERAWQGFSDAVTDYCRERL